VTAVDAHEDDAGPLLDGRYRLESHPGPARSGPVLADAYDEASDRAVTLALLPATSSLRDRLALRLQVRRVSESEHPGLAPVLDVVDTESTFALVLPLLPGARLLTEVGVLPEAGPEHLIEAVEALHAVGRAHGALDERAVVVLPDSTVLLLPLPPEPGALPAEDLPALERLVSRYGASPADAVPSQRHGGLHPAQPERATGDAPRAALQAQPVPRSFPPHGATAVVRHRRTWRPAAVRAALVLCGALGGAVLADLLSRLVS
jgi:hypothetical protein